MQSRRPTIVLICCAFALIASSPAPAQRTSGDTRSPVRAGIATIEPSARRNGLEEAIVALNELIEMPVPRGLSRAERSTWTEQTRWLASVRDRYRDLSGSYTALRSNSAGQDAAAPFVPGGAVVSSAVSGLGTSSAPAGANQLNDRFAELQQGVQNESRRFQTLSNALKARHDTAMNAIRNMK